MGRFMFVRLRPHQTQQHANGVSQATAVIDGERPSADIVVAQPDPTQRPIVLQKQITFLGRRQESCDVHLDDQQVSKVHCLIEKNDRQLVLMDLGSRNGTTVNEQHINLAILKSGDIIGIAHLRFLVEISETAIADAEVSGNKLHALRIPESLVETDSDDLWHFKISGIKLGPATRRRLVRMLTEGEISLDDVVCRQHEQEWITVREFLARGQNTLRPDAERGASSPPPPADVTKAETQPIGLNPTVELSSQHENSAVSPNTIPASSAVIDCESISADTPMPCRFAANHSAATGTVQPESPATKLLPSGFKINPKLRKDDDPHDEVDEEEEDPAKGIVLPRRKHFVPEESQQLPLPARAASLVRSHPRKVVVGVIALGVMLFLLSIDRSLQEDYALFENLYSEFTVLRSRNVSQAEWQGFYQRAILVTEPIVRKLERTASSRERGKQELLRAGRDYFPRMLVTAREHPNEFEEKFLFHLENARTILSGSEIDDTVRQSEVPAYPWRPPVSSDAVRQ